ncbi:MAG: cellulase family glycosylhydrolase [Ruminococcus sp.]|nr:cellulase family glycosylhydrolase [Ruminococcus sp.]
MKITGKRAAAFLSAAVMGVTTGAVYAPAAANAPLTAFAADDCNDDWLHAVGSKLYDANGNQVWLTGANWFGLNCTENFPHGLWSADVDELLSGVADHGINIIRFPISSELLISWMNGYPYACEGLNPKNTDGYKFNPDFCHADGTEMNSMEVFDVIMQKCKKYGIKALVDVHSPSSHNSGHNYELWYYEGSSKTADDMATIKEEKYAPNAGDPVTFDDWVDSITWLAKKYSKDDTIIAYDLKNEPHGKRGYDGKSCPTDIAKWDDSTDLNNWKYASETCANSILAVNPNALILIEGIEQYPKTEKGYTFDTPDIWNAPADKSPWYGAWWGGNLRGVKDYPVTPTSGTSQIVYSPHDYGPSVYREQAWFHLDEDPTGMSFDTQSLLDEYWYDTWAYINDKDIAPLLIGEWGGHMDGAENQRWMTLLRDYMINNHINHTFWCLNPNSGDTGGLLDSQFKVWDDKKYALFEESLWQTLTTGKYIGLDHQTALGKNGLSLSEFYSSYAETEGSNINGGTKGGGHTGTTTTKTTTVTITTTEPPTTTTTTGPTSGDDIKWGDANCDGEVNMADAVLIMQSIGNPDKYGKGTDDGITEKGEKNADVFNTGDGVTNKDALTIQKYKLGLLTEFPPKNQ